MKQLLIGALALIIVLPSCSKPGKEPEEPALPEIKINKTTLTLSGAVGASDTLYLQSNVAWTVASSAAWLQVSSSAGNGNTKIILTTVERNTTPTARTATVTIAAAGNTTQPIIISVTQEAETLQETSFTVFGSRLFGGSGDETAYSVAIGNDGYILVGSTASSDGDLTGNKGALDGWLVKTDPEGQVVWQKNFGGSGRDDLRSIVATADGGFLAAGFTSSINDDAAGNHGLTDAWLIKVDAGGNKVWSKVYGGADNDYFISLTKGSDNGYIAVGTTSSPGVGEASSPNLVGENMWVIKLDEQGSILWSKIFGGSSNEQGNTVTVTPDGGCLVAGFTLSDGSGDVHSKSGMEDALVIKLDAAGNKIWAYTYGGSQADFVQAVVPANSGGYILSGYSKSSDRNLSVNRGQTDAWLLRIDEKGNLLWSKTYGGSGHDCLYSVCPAIEGGYIATGFTLSNDGDISGNADKDGALFIRIDENGTKTASVVYGGSGGDDAQGIVPVSGEGYVVAGFSKSNDGPVSGNHGSWDAWLMTLAK